MPIHRIRPHITGLLIDISGNLHVDSTPTPNAVEAFQSLIDSKIPFRLCSNTSKESSISLENKLKSMGFNLIVPNADRNYLQSVGGNEVITHDQVQGKQPQLVWTSLGAVSQLLKEMNLKKPYLLLSSSAREEIVARTRLWQHDHCQPNCETGSTNHVYDSVVVGLAPSSFDYANLNEAFRIIKGEMTTTHDSSPHNAVPLIATHKAKYFQTESGLLSLGPGPFVTALEYATGVQATVVGKPTRKFFETVINDFSETEIPDFGKGRIIVIGDDVEADLGEGAVELNLWRILVKTGKYRIGDENRAGVVPPDEVFDSFASFVDNLVARMDHQVI